MDGPGVCIHRRDAQDEMEQAQIDEILLRNGVVTVNEYGGAGLAEII